MAKSAAQEALDGVGLTRMYELMALARAVDDRLWLLNRQGKVHFVISGRGHEAAQVGLGLALDPERDILCPYYRDLALVLAWGMTPLEVMLGAFGREADPCSGGRQMPNHWGHRPLRIVTGSSPVTTQALHAVGTALASRYRREPAVSVACFGEGSASQGEFHEALNVAAVWKLPVVFVCENNGYAISLPAARQMAVASVAERAAGYGMPGATVDGLDPVASWEASHEAVERARRGDGPSLLEFRVMRLTAHSSDDDDRTYRGRDELERERGLDPVPRLRERLLRSGHWTEERDAALTARIRRTVDDATDRAEAAPLPPATSLRRHVYAEVPSP